MGGAGPVAGRDNFALGARIRGENSVPGGCSHMDGLPGELCFKIFHLLDHQSLAAAPQGSLARSLAAFDQNSAVTSYVDILLSATLLLMSTSCYQLLYQKSSVTSYVAMASFLVLPRPSRSFRCSLSWHFLLFCTSIIHNLPWPELPELFSLQEVERADLRRRAVAQAVRGPVGRGRHGVLRAGAGGLQALEGRLRRAGPMRSIRPGRQDHQGGKRLLPHLPRRDPELPGHQLRRQGRAAAGS